MPPTGARIERRNRMKAYVLIQTEPAASPVAQSLRAIPGVVAAEDVSGAYDAIVLARSGSEQNLIDDVVAEIRKLPSVTHALPAPLITPWAPGSTPERSDRLSLARGAAA
jgi:DNA-binding Lrp family transcriptional regulator